MISYYFYFVLRISKVIFFLFCSQNLKSNFLSLKTCPNMPINQYQEILSCQKQKLLLTKNLFSEGKFKWMKAVLIQKHNKVQSNTILLELEQVNKPLRYFLICKNRENTTHLEGGNMDYNKRSGSACQNTQQMVLGSKLHMTCLL